MAKDKRSFIMYGSSESNLKHLTDEEVGKLFRHIFAFVNDKNPVIDPTDRFLNLAFEHFKEHLERDLATYKETIEKRRAAGSAGGRKASEERAKQKQANEASASKSNDCVANQADNVNDNGNVNVNDNGNNFLLEKETKEEEINKEILESEKVPDPAPQRAKAKKAKDENVPDPLDGLEMPQGFQPTWLAWIEYRKAKKKKPYAAKKFEQVALNKLIKLSESDPAVAAQILTQTIENSHESFYPLRNDYVSNNNNRGNASNEGRANTTPNNRIVQKGTISARAIAAKLRNGQTESDHKGEVVEFQVEAM